MKIVLDILAVTVVCVIVGNKLGFNAIETFIVAASVSWMYGCCSREKKQ